MEAIKKIFLHRTRFVNNLLTRIEVADVEKTTVLLDALPEVSRLASCPNCFTRRHGYKPSSPSSNHPVLAPAVSVVFLNIPSFAGGLDLWASAQGKNGAFIPTAAQQCSCQFPSLCRNLRQNLVDSCNTKDPQDFGDGKLEILSFQSLAELSLTNLQRFCPSNYYSPSGWRLFQGDGPFKIPFRPNLSSRQRIYFQIDGEYFVTSRIEK